MTGQRPSAPLPRVLATVLAAAVLAACGASRETRNQRVDQYLENGQFRAALVEVRNLMGESPNDPATRVRYGRALIGDGDPGAAAIELRKARELGAPAATVLPVLADALIRSGQLEEVQKLFDAPEAKAVNTAEMVAMRGKAQLAGGHAVEAREAFAAALAADPRNVAARIGLATIRATADGPQAALEELSRAAKDHPQNVEVAATLGITMMQAGQAGPAAEQLARTRTLAKEKGQRVPQMIALSALADLALQRRDVAGAKKFADDLVALAPKTEPTLLLQARMALMENRLSDAQAAVQSLLAMSPDNPRAKLLQGALSMAQGNNEQAEMYLKALVAKNPKDTVARQMLTQVQLKLNKPEEAMKSAAGGDGGTTDLVAAARASMMAGNLAKAIDYYQQAAKAAPNDPERRFDLATALMAAGRSAEAIPVLESLKGAQGEVKYRAQAAYQAALARTGKADAARAAALAFANANAKDARALMVAAEGLGYAKDTTAMRQVLTQASEVDAKLAQPLVLLGRLALSQNDRDGAAASFNAALARDAKSVDALMGLGMVAGQKGDIAGATTQFEAARAASADSLPPRIGLARLYLTNGQWQKAVAPMAEARRLAPDNADVRYLGAWLDIEQGSGRDAAIALEKLAKEQPDKAEVFGLLARAYDITGNAQAAALASERALKLDPQQWQSAVVAFRAAATQGDTARAAAAIAQMKAGKAPASIVALSEGDLALVKKDYAGAVRVLEPVHKQAPTRLLAVRLFQAKKGLNAPDRRDPLEAWLRGNPKDFPVRQILAEDLQLAGETKRAIAEYEAVLRESGNDVRALNNLSVLKLDAGDVKAANDFAGRAYKVAPKDPSIADTYAWALVAAGKAQDAVPLLRTAYEALKTDEVRYHYAVALVKSGAAAQAKPHLQALTKAGPDFRHGEEVRKLLGST